MSRNWMTEEGDRSGVVTPSKRDKAKNRIEAAVQRLQLMLTRWDDVDVKEFVIEMGAAETSLNAALQLMLDES
jgi:hypothetical protein